MGVKIVLIIGELIKYISTGRASSSTDYHMLQVGKLACINVKSFMGL